MFDCQAVVDSLQRSTQQVASLAERLKTLGAESLSSEVASLLLSCKLKLF
jgi:hypothetical protein